MGGADDGVAGSGPADKARQSLGRLGGGELHRGGTVVNLHPMTGRRHHHTLTTPFRSRVARTRVRERSTSDKGHPLVTEPGQVINAIGDSLSFPGSVSL
jgi:hypothetical protein